MNRIPHEQTDQVAGSESRIAVSVQTKVELKTHDPAFLFNLFCGRMLNELIIQEMRAIGIRCDAHQTGTFPMAGFWFIYGVDDLASAQNAIQVVLERQQLHFISQIYIWEGPHGDLRRTSPGDGPSLISENQVFGAIAAAKAKTAEALKIWKQVAAWDN